MSLTVNSQGHSIFENVKQCGRARFLLRAILARVIYRLLDFPTFYKFTFLPNSKEFALESDTYGIKIQIDVGTVVHL